MRKVELTMNEQNKYLIIKKLVESNGNKKRAAIKLGCTIRTVDRLILKYKNQGKRGFVHGNRGRTPSVAFPLDIKNKIIRLLPRWSILTQTLPISARSFGRI